jgi:hypothetical protein
VNATEEGSFDDGSEPSSSYQPLTDCSWVLRVPAGRRVRLEVCLPQREREGERERERESEGSEWEREWERERVRVSKWERERERERERVSEREREREDTAMGESCES